LKNRIALNAAKNKRSIRPPLKTFLDPIFRKYHHPRFLVSDPLEFAHRFQDPWDQEVVALFSAVLAYGNVTQIRRSVESLLARIQGLGLTPKELIWSLETDQGSQSWSKALDGFVHRFNVGADLHLLSRMLARSWVNHGSLGAHLIRNLRSEDQDFGQALDLVFKDWESWRTEWERRGEVSPGKGFGYLISSPERGSACKRWCMFLRWMVRKDELDLGLWAKGSRLLPEGSAGMRPDQLVMPLDTHTGRIGSYIGLTRRKTLDWKAAQEVTQRLRECDAEDPVKYDFALCRLGILDICQRRFRVEICEKCDLLPVCKFARKKLSSSASRSTPS
jgi:uncharacterized protein (TIGR02757 family)